MISIIYYKDGTDKSLGSYEHWALSRPCEEAGWGIIAEGLPGATTLRYTSVPLLPSEECETAYSTAPDVNALCAGDIGGGIGSCVGDNGGGLYCWSPNSQRYVVGGVISWREGCALPGKPGIYMDIAKYRDWILSIINASSISKG
ncbi:hypothetical protein SK128_027495 [Halocaridina rubra]|uniref:Peptidase S1 domain-containing protein n=1 Tax=Halocaridina rubra TaxID=373956 RepID=A0AAN8XIW0_HALRR